MSKTTFQKLNIGWNADPNIPIPEYALENGTLKVRFRPNMFQYPEYSTCNFLTLEFISCSRFRFTMVNDHSWYEGGCRFSGKAPEWGEFYHVSGDFLEDEEKTPWHITGVNDQKVKNSVFYFRDEALECSSVTWKLHRDLVDSLNYREPHPICN